MTIDLTNALAFLLIMLRMTGMLVFNPILGRANIPTMLNAGFAFLMAILLVGTVPAPELGQPSLIVFLILAIKELAVGFLGGFLMRMYLSILVVGGEVIDMQLGIAMSKVFDPATNSSIALTAGIYNSLFILTFFITNNHLTFIHLSSQSFEVLPLGWTLFNTNILYHIPQLFSTLLIFSIKLCMPVVIVELVVTMAVGIIMRIIPQINVFVVNIQFKLLVGMFILVVLVAPMMGYFENLIEFCFDNIQYVWTNFVPEG